MKKVVGALALAIPVAGIAAYAPLSLSQAFKYLGIALIVTMFGKMAVFMALSSRHHRTNRRPNLTLKACPRVSIIVPCYNEELTLSNCVESLLKQNYSNYEIILVDDGSTDDTLSLARRLRAAKNRRVVALTKENAGKAAALNFGIKHAQGSIVVCMDADSIFLPETVSHLVHSLEDPSVDAVGGNVKVVNRKSAFGRFQGLEYIVGQTIQRRAFSHAKCMQVISGAVGAFRKSALDEIGGYPTDTIVEDMDVTIALARAGFRVVFNPRAIAYTEAPSKLGDFMRQRYRWTYGGYQVLGKHRDMIGQRTRMGLVGLPYFGVFPLVDALVSGMFFVAIARVAITGSGLDMLAFFAVMSMLQMFMVLYVLVIDREDKRLLLLTGLDSLWYNHLLSLVTLWAGFNYLFRNGKQVSWNKPERYGLNVITETN